MRATNESVKVNQLLAACIASSGGIGVGLSLAWTATALESLETTGHVGLLSSIQKSWIASLLTIGAIASCPVTGFLVNYLGRKPTLVWYALLGVPGWLLLGFATHPNCLYFGRIIIGITVGGCGIVIPVYIREISSKENRGLLGSFFLVMLCFGKFISNGIGILFPQHIASFLCTLQPMLYAVALCCIPESPVFLARQNRSEEAYISLSWLSSPSFSLFLRWRSFSSSDSKFGMGETETPPPPPLWEQSESHATSLSSCMSSWKTFLSQPCSGGGVIRPTLTTLFLMWLAQFCGINLTTFYTLELFHLSSGEAFLDSKYATVILSAIQTIGCIPAAFVVDRYGRKILIQSSLVAMTLALMTLTGYVFGKIFNASIIDHYPGLGIVPLGSLVVYSLAYSWGLGTVVWIIMSEILPPQIVEPASAVANMLYWGGAFAITLTYRMWSTVVPLQYWLIGFTLVCIVGIGVVHTILPETKGLSFEEIQALYAQNVRENDNVKQ